MLGCHRRRGVGPVYMQNDMSILHRQKNLLLQELVSLSAEEVYTILCLPAMSQEHVLTAPLPKGTYTTVGKPQQNCFVVLPGCCAQTHHANSPVSSKRSIMYRYKLSSCSATAGINTEKG